MKPFYYLSKLKQFQANSSITDFHFIFRNNLKNTKHNILKN